VSGVQAALFGTADALPEGMRYATEFITREEEAALLRTIGELPFTEAKHREYTARRRIMLYGPGIPEFLLPLRDRLAAWMGLAPEEFRHALINEYRRSAGTATRPSTAWWAACRSARRASCACAPTRRGAGATRT
jgi:hypothetical protein